MASPLTNTLTVCRASAGTGKTYTLAANYVALLLSKQSYRSILAVTFTNKATQEMKDRILLFLDNIANNTGPEAVAALQAVRGRMIANQSASDDELRAEAARCYRNMLEDYDNIHISTIDTFLMQLLNGLGQMLDDASAGAQVELDLDHLITIAVDNQLTRPVMRQTAVAQHLTNYVGELLGEGKDWDIRSQLIQIANKMYNEAVQQMDSNGEIVFDAAAITKYKANCDWRHIACYKELRDIYDLWKNWKTEDDGISGASYVDTFLTEIGTYLNGTCEEKNMFRGLSDDKRKKVDDANGGTLRKKYAKNPARAEQVVAALIKMHELCRQCRPAYFTHKYTIALLNDLALMTALRGEIQALLVEQNSVLLAQTADKLHRAMAVGDADFILEKAGIRYHHIMLDEFQDTSVLQWENFKPLAEEILANGGTVFIVGDIKQSIYRWRNGDWHIMANLGKDTPHLGAFFQEMSLRRNFRSAREVVKFNLDLFEKLATPAYGNSVAAPHYKDKIDADHPLTDYYKVGHDGGYVQLMLVPYAGISPKPAREQILPQVFTDIESLLTRGESPSDIMILVRNHSDSEDIVRYYYKLALQSPLWAQTPLVSCDSFHLESSRSVQFIIQALRWRVLQNDVAKWYLRLVFPTADLAAIENLNVSIPLGELLEELLKLLPSQPNTPENKDLAYINALLDGVHDYVAKYGSDTAAFLTYWDDKMHEQSIAAPATDAIQIMTVHTAKGLEKKHVFIPFCSWDFEKDRKNDIIWCHAKGILKAPVEPLKQIPVKMISTVAESAYADEYLQEHQQQRFDNLNTLYVALTRARDSLYIYGEVPNSQLIGGKNTAAALLYGAFKDNWKEQDGAFFLSFGTPNANSNIVNDKIVNTLIDRFSFDKAQTIPAQMHVGERPIAFQMSRESLDSLKFTADDGHNARIDLGNVCHAIMERMETKEDRDFAINDAKMRGLITDEAAEQEIGRLIDAAWSNIQMLDWFSGHWELLREATFLTANAELRPDRVMIDRSTSTAIVLDYKFGQREKQYAQQVRNYMRIMAELNFRHVEGYIWYAQEAQLVPVTL